MILERATVKDYIEVIELGHHPKSNGKPLKHLKQGNDMTPPGMQAKSSPTPGASDSQVCYLESLGKG